MAASAMASEAGGAMPSIAHKGTSKPWLADKKNVLRVFGEFLQECSKQKLPFGSTPFEKLDHTTLCNRKLWEWFAGFLTQTYKKPAGGALGIKTAKAYFSTMMHLARDQCVRLETENNKKVRAETRLFFSCLIPKGTNEEARWMYGVKKNIVRFLFEVFKKTGETIDNSVQPVYMQHVFDLVQAYTNHGWTPENSRRSLEANGLRQVAGRPAEMSWLLTESMDFDPFYSQLFSELPESKPGKMKLVAFAAGPCPELCFFTCLADYFAHAQPFLHVKEDDDDVTPFFPVLNKLARPGSKIGTYFQQLRPNAGGVYKDVATESLQYATAQG